MIAYLSIRCTMLDRAARAFAPGDEVRISYGRHPGDFLLVEYGFVMGGGREGGEQ